MDAFLEFTSRLIYASGTEAVITPNHRDFVGIRRRFFIDRSHEYVVELVLHQGRRYARPIDEREHRIDRRAFHSQFLAHASARSVTQ